MQNILLDLLGDSDLSQVADIAPSPSANTFKKNAVDNKDNATITNNQGFMDLLGMDMLTTNIHENVNANCAINTLHNVLDASSCSGNVGGDGKAGDPLNLNILNNTDTANIASENGLSSIMSPMSAITPMSSTASVLSESPSIPSLLPHTIIVGY